MINSNKEFVIKNRPCPYIENRLSDTKYLFLLSCSQKRCEDLTKNGYRRFGIIFLLPVCKTCQECVSVRIRVKDFEFSKSYKRILRKNQDVKLVVRRPLLSQEHLNLHKIYHAYKNQTKNWDCETIDILSYQESFIDGHNLYGYEFAYYLENKLIGVAITDLFDESLSANYSFYDPNFPKRSLGTFSILNQILYAKANGLDYVYLGYWVKQNASLKYKERFKPFEVLSQNAQGMPVWTNYEG